jgi:hypothetical protein
VEFRQLSMAEAARDLAPGQRVNGLDPKTGRVIARVVGRVPNDGSTRQQRRAAERNAG